MAAGGGGDVAAVVAAVVAVAGEAVGAVAGPGGEGEERSWVMRAHARTIEDCNDWMNRRRR